MTQISAAPDAPQPTSPVGRSSSTDTSADVALLGLVALAVVMPFEQLRPVLRLPWQQVTTVELTLLVSAAIWVASLVTSRTWPQWRTPLTTPWLTVLVVLLLAAILAPDHRADALKTVARLASGFAIYLMALNAITNVERLSVLVAAAVGTGVVVAAVAILEFRGVPMVLAWLNQYREGVRVVGGQVRSGGTLQYPTIAAMYFEIVIAMGCGLLLFAWDRRATTPHSSLIIGALLLALIVVGEGLSLTFTRAGLIGMAASLMAVAFWRFRRAGVDGGVWLIASLTLVLLLLPVWSWSAEAVRLRFTSEGRQGWYRAAFAAAPNMSMGTGEDTFINVSVTNLGRVTWQPTDEAPFRASYHWFDGRTDRVIQYDGARTELPGAVPPGATVPLAMQVRAPEKPGTYRLAWDVVQEHRLWFSTESGATPSWTTVRVIADGIPARPLSVGRGPRVIPEQVVVLGRMALWTAAIKMFAARPVLGFGPDNFRLSYGPYAGQTHADPRVHSNSMYLEWLTSAGLVGAFAFGWMLWRAGCVIRQTRARLSPCTASLYAGVSAAGVAVLVHGTLDSFLTFTPTYVAMALMLGLAAAPSMWRARGAAEQVA